MERLLLHLAADMVAQVWLESRGASLDRRDVTMVAAMRSTGAMPAALTVRFARPLDEPMLWVPDAVAGAFAAAKKGRADYTRSLRAKVVELEVPL